MGELSVTRDVIRERVRLEARRQWVTVGELGLDCWGVHCGNMGVIARQPALLNAHFAPMNAGATHFGARRPPRVRRMLRTTHIENLLCCLPHSFLSGSPFAFQFQR